MFVDLKIDCPPDPGSAIGVDVSRLHPDIFTFGPVAIFQGQLVVGLILEISMGNDMSILPFTVERCFPMDARLRIPLNVLDA